MTGSEIPQIPKLYYLLNKNVGIDLRGELCSTATFRRFVRAYF